VTLLVPLKLWSADRHHWLAPEGLGVLAALLGLEAAAVNAVLHTCAQLAASRQLEELRDSKPGPERPERLPYWWEVAKLHKDFQQVESRREGC